MIYLLTRNEYICNFGRFFQKFESKKHNLAVSNKDLNKNTKYRCAANLIVCDS